MSGAKIKRFAARAGAVVLGCALVAEIAVRASGLTDFPAYAVDDEVGYIVRPNQSGRFLRSNDWAFNSKSMPTDVEWNPAAQPAILLIGNSIVMGGNHYAQKDKLTPLLSARLGDGIQVWPAAIGGWTTVNEVAYLRRNADVVQAATFFVWEYMSGGLSGATQWAGDYVFPSARPVWATGYVVRRYLLPRFMSFAGSELPPVGDLRARHLADFRAEIAVLSKPAKRRHPGLIFLYPTRTELLAARRGTDWLPERAVIGKVCADYGVRLIDIADYAEWTPALYRDGVHPTVAGNAVLASILASAIATTR